MSMLQRSFLLISIIAVLASASCIKENYDMNRLSKKMHLSPTLAISAVKGDIAFSDFVKSGDTVVFDRTDLNLVKIIFKKDSIFNLQLSDFTSSKSMIRPGENVLEASSSLLYATLEPYTFNLEIEEILNRLTGEIHISNPSIKFKYSNSFLNPVQFKFNITGKRKNKIIGLNLAPFNILSPVAPDFLEAKSTYLINKTNSSLDSIISMPPGEITFSGFASISTPGKSDINVVSNNKLVGSIEIEVPLNFHMNNLQYTDTVDNFLKENSGANDNPVKPENFELLRIDFSAKNGFPLGISLDMILYDSGTGNKRTVQADGILKPAPVDSNGKAAGVTETLTKIEFTREYFQSIPKSDKIIFRFTLVTSGSGTKDVKIYSDYRLDFKAALVWKPDIIFK
jgi:hypothetical protein